MIQPMEIDDFALLNSDEYCIVSFNTPRRIVSNASVNGGFRKARHIVNMKVPSNNPKQRKNDTFPPLERTFTEFTREHGLKGTAVGLFTSASMDSFRFFHEKLDDLYFFACVTTGLANARRAGDRADIQNFNDIRPPEGTINLIAGTNGRVSDSGMIEALCLASEMKTAVLHAMDFRSPVSGKHATGTGTDVTVFFSGSGRELPYCGKHVKAGELIARVAETVLEDSLRWYTSNSP